MKNENVKQVPVAIIGIGCIFAKSADLKSFLHTLKRGVNGISDPPATHQYLADYFDPDPKKPDHIYCNRGGYLPNVDFDPTEFSIPPNALEATDTSQLLGLVTAKKALADAGYGTEGKVFDRTKASVILGVTGTQELVIPLGARLGHPIWQQALADAGVEKQKAAEVIQRISDGYVGWQENSFPGLLGNVVAGRIANRLDLGGTNCVVDAACASSMGAVHMALLELTSGRSDMVITGGVDTINDAFMHMCFSKTQILSASGDVRPFSKDADGTVLGEGVGLVVLKRLEEAERDGDRVYAVIKGIGSASDGKSQSIYAPKPEGQSRALKRAYEAAGIDPKSVDLVEAHGTGTRVGDQVEFKALCDVFGAQSPNGNRCALGSVKSNIGHTKAAAGTAGLIKTAFSIYHKVLPPTLKADEADPKLGLAHSPFYLNTRLRPWVSRNGEKRRAGVSAFGFGGSNFHTVLEEHKSSKIEPSWDGAIEIAAFSGNSKKEVKHKITRWTRDIQKQPTIHHIGKLAKQSRYQFDIHASHRLVMALDLMQPMEKLQSIWQHALEGLDDGQRITHDAVFYGEGRKPGKLAFLMPGQGSQYVGMGRDLNCCFPQSLAAFQDAAASFKADHGLEDYIYPRIDSANPSHEATLRETQVAQPAIGAVTAAMLTAMKLFNVVPDATCGHSYGELTALRAAGWISQQDLWVLSNERGRLMADAGKAAGEAGTMLAVRAPLDEIEALLATLDSPVVLANRNSHEQGVLSGPLKAIELAESACKSKDWKTIRLPVAAAFHSHLVAQAQKPFADKVADVKITPNDTMVMSNTHGGVYPRDGEQVAALLGGQLAQPVDFVGNIEMLYAKGFRTFVEVGPKNVLTGLVRQTLKGKDALAVALDQSCGRHSGLMDLAKTLSCLAAQGHGVALKRWEKAAAPPRKARMAISLSGANYRNPQSVNKNTTSPSVTATKKSAPVPRQKGPELKRADKELNNLPNKAADIARTQRPVPTHIEHKPVDPSNQKSLQSAMSTVQQGLASLQALQSQTTLAHQKYLDTQAEASRTLQHLIQCTQQLSQTTLVGYAMAPPEPLLRQPTPSTSDRKVQEPVAKPVSAILESKTPQQAAPHPGRPKNNLQLQQSLVAIVSELTGYPEDMLDLGMDIEADLGIDSIKRVEILSALEEKMPDLPKVTPDMMGTLKTLGQICDYLAENSSTSPAPQQAPQPEASQVAPVNPGGLQQSLVAIVSELTGYPEDMLDLGMDIEADLGIDSIKRVEILSALEEKMPDLPKVTPDMMGTLKTLGQICDYLNNPVSPVSETPCNRACEAPSANKTPATEAAVDRQIVKMVSLPPDQAGQSQWSARNIFGIVGGPKRLSDALVKAFKAQGLEAKKMSDSQTLSSLNNLCALVLIAPLPAQEAFQWVQAASPLLQQAAKQDAAGLFTLSFLDGAFGFSDRGIDTPDQGALAGLSKTAGLEWPDINCLALDIDPDWRDEDAVSQAVVNEVLHVTPQTPSEIGLNPDGRVGLQLTSASLSTSSTKLNLSPQDVMVVTGGARGVTAAAAMALSDHTPCILAVMGRSPEPQPEPQWLSDLHAPGDMKKAIIANLFDNRRPTPAQVEAIYKQYAANREIQANLEQLKQKGATARYCSVDVRNPAAVKASLDYIRNNLGPIKGLVHGAGVLSDRRIGDKELAQFQIVYDTKVQGLQTLLEGTQEDRLRYIVLFSSVSARMGNYGQVDYAMANEVLNKVAQQQARLRTDCKVIAINWGPWDGGMVTPGLKQNFTNRGVGLIPLESGAMAMVDEMGQPSRGPVEVIIGSSLHHDSQPAEPVSTVPAPAPEQMTLICKREIDLNNYLVLNSHQIDGRPVVPLALITEWLAHSALHANPGLTLHGIDHLRLFNGIAMDRQKRSVQMLAGKTERKGELFEVDVEIRNGFKEQVEKVHSSAKAILTENLPAAPKFKENGHFKSQPARHSLDEIYESVLFHGDDLRGILEIIAISDHGMSARIASAPLPAKWISEPLRSRWIADPLVLDSAFQMAIVWCYEQSGRVSLPSYAKSYRQYCRRFPSDGVSAVMKIDKFTEHKLVSDFTFLDQQKRVVASLNGYEAVMTPNLMKAFKAA